MVLFGDQAVEALGAYGLTEHEVAAIGEMLIWRQAVASNKILIVADTDSGPQFDPSAGASLPHWRSFAVAPLRAPNGIAVGGMAIFDREPREMSLHEELLLRDFRDTAEELIRLRAELLHDPATRVWSRRYIENLLNGEWDSTYTHLRPVTLMRIRVLPIRDARELRSIATFLSTSFRRSSDIVGVYGADEFIALLPETNPEGAQVLGRWLCSSIGEALKNPQAKVSIGAATAISDEDFVEGPTRLLELARRSLLDAQTAEASCFVIHEENDGRDGGW
jgi:GGDEF domain-containing protein